MTIACKPTACDIPCMLAERHHSYPEMDITNVRSMELFRRFRFGLTLVLRAVAIPEFNNFDVAWVTIMADPELHIAWRGDAGAIG